MTSPNPVPPNGDTSSAELPDDIPTLQAQLAALDIEMQAVVATVRRLMAEEDMAAGVFRAREIFQAQQEKLRLQAEMDLRRRRIRRIQYGMQ